MVATYTDNLRITKQGDNDNPTTWGQVVNTQVIELLEEAISGVIEVDVTGSSDVNLAASAANGTTDTARHAVLEVTGTITTDIDLIVPSVEKTYIIKADYSGGVVTVKPAGGASGIALTTGLNYIVYTQGTNIEKVADNAAPDLSAYLAAAQNLADLDDAATARTNLGVKTQTEILQAVYPVGSIYINATNATNPGTLLGFGTWTAFGAGRVPVGFDGSDTDFDTSEKTGGAKTHTLTEDEIPDLNGSVPARNYQNQSPDGTNKDFLSFGAGGAVGEDTFTGLIKSGGGEAHPNMQPYITVYMWKRTA